jgi:hypothetical protein|uniref:Uncharacterized protein n=1 Tax=viral metagenome TaxID=1070528 RepID=A0A6C0KQG5_9ZZZZ
MDFVFVLVCGNEWEDITILLSEEDAINESKNYPNNRVEIFSKNNKFGFTPTYNYYKNGMLVKNS